MLGAHVGGHAPNKLKQVMEKEKLTWRSFAAQGAISARWNPATPTFYVIDPRGVIRHKWVGSPGAKALDAALEKLIQEVEANGKRATK